MPGNVATSDVDLAAGTGGTPPAPRPNDRRPNDRRPKGPRPHDPRPHDRRPHDRPPPLGAVRRAVREVGLGLVTAGVVLLAFVAYQLVGTNFAEEHNQQQLATTFQRALSRSTADTPTVTPPGATPVAPGAPTPAAPTRTAPIQTAPIPVPGAPITEAVDHLVIPKIGVNSYVVEGVDESDLQHGPGHYRQTVLPGEVGNAAIAGHRTTYGAPFFRLDELAIGDPIQVTGTQNGHFTYLVDRMEVVDPSDVGVLDNTPNVAELTLTTCNPRFEASSRLVVVARLSPGTATLPAPTPQQQAQQGRHGQVGRASGAPGLDRGNSLASGNSLGSGNSSAWPSVILFGAISLLGWIIVRLLINRTRRLRRLGAYVGGIALCAVPLWFLFENVVRLLPQAI